VKKIRFDDEEWKRVEARSLEAGLPPSTFVRQAALASVPTTIPEVNREAWAALARPLGNINQLAHHLNSGQPTDKVNWANVSAGIERLAIDIRALRNSLVGVSEQEEE
jgi:HAMP domain-containing protein